MLFFTRQTPTLIIQYKCLLVCAARVEPEVRAGRCVNKYRFVSALDSQHRSEVPGGRTSRLLGHLC